MPKLTRSLNAWNTQQFNEVFTREITQLSLDELPLQQALQLGSYATKDNFQIMINSKNELADNIVITTGIFYSSIIAGCNCSDDPTPVDINPEYCEIQFIIDKASANTVIHITT